MTSLSDSGLRIENKTRWIFACMQCLYAPTLLISHSDKVNLLLLIAWPLNGCGFYRTLFGKYKSGM